MKSVPSVVVRIGGAVGLALLLMCGSAAGHDGGGGGGHGGGGHGGSGGGHGSSGGHGGARGGQFAHGGVWAGGGWGGSHHHHHRCCGWDIGFVDYWYPYPYPYPWVDEGFWDPYWYAGPPANSYAQPAPPPPPSYWYYCSDSGSYYPYVQQCASGWQKVLPTPPR
jgi:hypothetical protein